MGEEVEDRKEDDDKEEWKRKKRRRKREGNALRNECCERKVHVRVELLRDSNRSDVEKETAPFSGIRNIHGRVGPHHWP